jgi:hypothetical protein
LYEQLADLYNLTNPEMKILISGFVVFVIWCIISVWLYNDKLLPSINNLVTVKALPESQTNPADSLMNLKSQIGDNFFGISR